MLIHTSAAEVSQMFYEVCMQMGQDIVAIVDMGVRMQQANKQICCQQQGSACH